MRLTRKTAIDLSIKLWTWLARTGELKYQWPGWKDYDDVQSHCFLCQYGMRVCDSMRTDAGLCKKCPYYKYYKKQCYGLGSPYDLWDYAITPQGKKHYARLFLEELKTIRSALRKKA